MSSKTIKKCQIGSTVFDAGVDKERIIERAYTEYERKHSCFECGTMKRKLSNGLCEECFNLSEGI